MSHRTTPSVGSVTHWLGELSDGNVDEAQRQIWLHYFHELVEFARRRLGDSSRAVRDEEDAVLSALDSFFRRFQDGKFPELLSRDALWPLLITITGRKASDHRRWSQAQRRSAKVRIDNGPTAGVPRIEDVVSRHPSPEFALEIAEETERLINSLPREELKATALLKLQGDSNQEIAAKHQVIERTIERRLALIRSLWSARLELAESNAVESSD